MPEKNKSPGQIELPVDQAIRLAVQHHQAGRLGEAEDIYRRILTTVPNHVRALHMLGLLAGQTGHKDAAIELVLSALKLDPSLAEAHSNLGNIYREKFLLNGDAMLLDTAVASYRRAIELRPDFADAYNNMGVSLRDLGKKDEAIAAHRKAIELRPDFAQAYNNLGNS